MYLTRVVACKWIVNFATLTMVGHQETDILFAAQTFIQSSDSFSSLEELFHPVQLQGHQ